MGSNPTLATAKEITLTTISFIIPTHREDRPLARALGSIAPQLLPGDEVIVVGDVHDGPLPGVERFVTDAGFRYLSFDAGHHCWGHCQLNYALTQAQGGHIHMSDDDDIWTDNARDLMRRGTDVWPEKVLLYQFRSYYGNQVYWVPGTAGVFERARVGGHCALVPNVPEKVGRFSCEYDGDFDYVESSVKNFGGLSEVIWISELVAIARP